MTKEKKAAAAEPEKPGQFRIYLDDDNMNKLDKIAKKSGLTRTQKAKTIIVEYLNNYND